MSAVHLSRIDPARNMCRFYSIDVQPGARLQPDIARQARRGRLRRCQASDDEGRGQTLSFQSGFVWRHG
jgi:predicted DNA-binding WGR domain protein